MPVPVPARLAALASIRAQIFQTLHNPSGRHTGVQYLTRKLRGPLKVDYYPDPRPIKFKQLNAALRVEMEEHGFTGRSLDYWQLPDLREEKRLERLDYDRKRGKGPPKKGEGRRSTMKKKR